MSGMLTIPEAKDVIVGELAQNGDWIVASVDTRFAWPVKAQKFKYRGAEIWVLPLMKEAYPSIAMKRTGGRSREDCERLLMRFLSAVAWVESSGASVKYLTGGNLPRPMGRKGELGNMITPDLDLSYLPEPADEKALLAMALLREGRGLNHPGYAFLSSYRVLDVALPDPKTQMVWIDANLDKLTHAAKDALAKLQASGQTEIGKHLYASGRCAMAHAARKPIVDPDDPTDLRRLAEELPIIMELAELAIETILGVETSQTVWEKHLYELEGFRRLLGPVVVDHLIRAERIPDGTNLAGELPLVSVTIRRHEPYEPFKRMEVINLKQEGPLMQVTLASEAQTRFVFQLDFVAERLRFDIFNGVYGPEDDGTAQYAETRAEMARFFRDYVGNGQLHIVDANSGELLSRVGAFIPTNWFLDADGADADIERWKTEAAKRAGAGTAEPVER